MHIYIIRHGQTQMNKSAVLQGRSDHPLTEEGIRQAEEARDFFAARGVVFSRVYTSPLIRAIQTAEIITGGTAMSDPERPVPIFIEPRLIEMDYGPYEGLDLHHLPQEILTFFSDFVHNPAPEGMEPLPEVVARLGTFLEELRQDPLEGNVLFSTHAIAMKGALEYLTPESKGSYWSKYVGNCGIYETVLAHGSYTVPVEIRP